MRSLTLGIEHRQQQGLSPRLQRAVRLLHMSSLEFTQEVRDSIGSNPFLETDEGDDENPALGPDSGFSAPVMELPGVTELGSNMDAFSEAVAIESKEQSEALDAPFEAPPPDLETEHENWLEEGAYGSRNGDREDVNVLDFHAVQESLSDHLSMQLSVMPLSERDLVIAMTIVGSLDDDGYLRLPLSELGDITGLRPPPGDEELHIALTRVQSLDPAGVGARTLQECLLLQLNEIDCKRKRELARAIIHEHIKLLAAKDMAGLARALSCSFEEIPPVLECIRRLEPRPGGRFGSPQVQYVTPDVLVKKHRGKWTAFLNPAIVPKVRLNRAYVEMFQRNRETQHRELAAHLHEARWTVSNIEQRFTTILSISQAIVDRQSNFFEYGPLAMKPLGLREIAEEVGVHESTVSRVTNNKFMATPLGVFELKYFFSRAMTTVNGGECSATAIRGLISDLIGAESPLRPLSDAEVARQLARQGIVVARRTVTKYRQSLRIESFERRRKLS